MRGLQAQLDKLVRGPIRLGPDRVYRLYTGGLLLDRLLGVEDPQDGHYPEAWYASTVEAVTVRPEGMERPAIPEGLSKVEVGGEVVAFRDLVREFAGELVGERVVGRFGATVPLLAKFLDTAVPLIVQCHPGAAFARAYFNHPSGKNEAWVIVGLRDGIEPYPYLHLGFKPGMTKERFAEMLSRGDSSELHQCMHQVRVSVGDVYYVPAGVIHALGPGIMAIEIQEPADFTFRAEEYWLDRRLTPDQRHLGVGFEAMADAFSYEALTFEENMARYHFVPEPVMTAPSYRVDALLTGPPRHAFGIAKLTVVARGTVGLSQEFCIGLVTRGQGRLRWSDGEVSVKAGEGVFFPAVLPEVEVEPAGGSLGKPSGDLEIILCYLDEFPIARR